MGGIERHWPISAREAAIAIACSLEPESATELGGIPAIVPSIEGSAIATGFNTIWIDRVDPFWKGFAVQ